MTAVPPPPPPPASIPGPGRAASENDCRLFWSWVGEMRFELEALTAESPAFLEPLSRRAKALHPSLSCEVAFAKGGRVLRLTCEADPDAAPTVERLHALAPPMRGWTVERFRPRNPSIREVRVAGASLGPFDVEFTILRRGSRAEGDGGIALALFVRGLDAGAATEGGESPAAARCALALLERVLGEEDVMRGVSAIRLLPWEAVTDWPRLPLKDLAEAFDAARAAP